MSLGCCHCLLYADRVQWHAYPKQTRGLKLWLASVPHALPLYTAEQSGLLNAGKNIAAIGRIMVQRHQTHAIFLLIGGLLVVISLSLMGVTDVQAQTSNSCPEGQTWSLNRCVSEEERTCPTGFTYVADNGCVMIPEEVQACPSGYVMEGGRCQLTGQACPAGETWREGSCQARDEQSCPAGQERVNGSCFQITDTVCPVGHKWIDSETRCMDNNQTDGDGDDASAGNGSRRIRAPSILILSQTNVTVYEGCDFIYTVALKSEPSDDVTVTIGGLTDTDVTADPVTLTFTPDNWDDPQIVNITCAEDDDEVDDDVTVTHTVDGSGWDSVPDGELAIHIIDFDKAGVFISPTFWAKLEDCNDYYLISLITEPTADVTVTIGDPSNPDLTIEQSTLTFTPDNWEVPQAVTLTCTRDDDAVDDIVFVPHRVGGGDYDGLTVPDLSLTLFDLDIPGVTLSNNVLAVEEGDTGSYTVQLDTQPTGSVKVTINDPDNTDATANPAALTFTPQNWKNAGTVTVSVREDDDASDELTQVTHSVRGADYGSVTVEDLRVVIVDNDTVGLVIFPLSLTVVEGSTGTYTIKLLTEPTDDVKVNYYGYHADVALAPEFLTFTPQNWRSPQTVTVSALEDNDAYIGATVYISHNVFGGDYGGASADEVTLTITEDDTPSITIADSSVTMNEGDTRGYSVYLDTLPSGNVTVTINDPTDNTDVTTDPATLTFTPQTWNVPQTVTITAAEDDNAAEDTATVTHSVSGADYGSVTVDNVRVTVIDTVVSTQQLNTAGQSETDNTIFTNSVNAMNVAANTVSVAANPVNVATNLDRLYTTFTAGENVWHLLQGATSIEVEAYWLENAGSESGDTEILPTDIAGFDAVCLTVTPDANVTRYPINQQVVLPAEPENAGPGVWKLRLKVEWGAVAAGECNPASPTIPSNSVPAIDLDYEIQ